MGKHTLNAPEFMNGAGVPWRIFLIFNLKFGGCYTFNKIKKVENH